LIETPMRGPVRSSSGPSRPPTGSNRPGHRGGPVLSRSPVLVTFHHRAPSSPRSRFGRRRLPSPENPLREQARPL
jgi:hypothetical protein